MDDKIRDEEMKANGTYVAPKPFDFGDYAPANRDIPPHERKIIDELRAKRKKEKEMAKKRKVDQKDAEEFKILKTELRGGMEDINYQDGAEDAEDQDIGKN